MKRTRNIETRLRYARRSIKALEQQLSELKTHLIDTDKLISAAHVMSEGLRKVSDWRYDLDNELRRYCKDLARNWDNYVQKAKIPR